MYEKLAALERRLEALDRQMMDPAVASDGKRFRAVSQEAAHLRDIVDAWHVVRRLEQELADARELATDDDPDLREMARAEASALEEPLSEAKQALRVKLLPRDPYEGRPLMLEIRAGTGGDEAALFAADLFRMYARYGETQGLRVEPMSTSLVTVGGGSGKTLQGFKEVVAAVSGENAYSTFKFEAGVHRVQRVPATESQGRIHTSAATVAVLPEPDEVEVKIDPGDLDIQTMRAGGPGGQHQNKTSSAIRARWASPDGPSYAVVVRDHRSQHQNSKIALERLQALASADAADLAASRKGEARHLHHQLERGNPSRVFDGQSFRPA